MRGSKTGNLSLIQEWIQKKEAEVTFHTEVVEDWNSKNSSLTSPSARSPEPLATTGLSGVFPGCMDVPTFWKSLDGEESLITEIPAERFDWKAYYDPTGEAKGSIRTKWGGFIPDIASFDPKRFNILPAEADAMDPRQRLLLMSTWRTLEDAGLDPSSKEKSKTGVFIACEADEYAQTMREAGLGKTGYIKQADSLMANRISYYFNFSGPSEIVNTMCSGFAVALHRAVVALRTGEIDRAIVGAANLMLLPEPFIALTQGDQLSTQASVQSFGKGGDGYIRSEGVGTILLERWNASRTKDSTPPPIYAMIKHTAVNYNGQGGISMAAPNVESHVELIKTCYQEAGIDPQQLAYIEAQGMGLPVADIAEWSAMNRALAELCEERQVKAVPGFCRVSTLKPMVGHMHAASSLGALLKIIRSFQTKTIHKVLGFQEPNEYCDMEDSPCRLVAETEPWEDTTFPKLAAFHSYGSGGNNAHVLLEEAPVLTQEPRKRMTPQPFNLMRCWFTAEEIKRAVPPNLSQSLPLLPLQTTVHETVKTKAEKIVRPIIASLLRIKESEIPFETPLSELGFDSMNILTLSDQLKNAHGIQLNPAAFFEFAHLTDLSVHLAENFSEKLGLSQDELRLTQAPSAVTPQYHYESPLTTNHEIAVIGMSAIFPGANNIEAFWENLVNGVNCIGEIPEDRWDWRALAGDPAEGNKTDCKWGGFIQDHDTFDPLFFNLSPREAMFMDPQIRKILEEIWHALEDSGYPPSTLWGEKVGIFMGVSIEEYRFLCEQTDPSYIWESSISGIASLGIARISHFLNFKGPIDVTETACSSALVAVDKGVTAIQKGDCQMAIVGGGQLMLTPIPHISFRKTSAICQDGQCKTFSKEANGYVRGEGAGIMVLKNLDLAIKDQDPIHAIIKGSAVNHDGRSNSLTAPNPVGQADVIVQAQRRSQIDPSTITYIEAHGTGTPLGDPIEIQGLKRAFAQNGHSEMPTGYCGVATVKSHVGHLEIAAGIAGCIKTILQLKHKQLIKTLHFNELNPNIDIEGSPFYILEENKPWENLVDPQGNIIPLRAGVSAFGFSGVNAHVILEEYRPPERPVQTTISQDQLGIFVLSAKTEEGLKVYANTLVAYLKAEETVHLADLLYTFQVGREAMTERLAIICHDKHDLIRSLSAFADGQTDSQTLYRSLRPEEGLKIGETKAGKKYIQDLIQDREYQHIAELWVGGSPIEWHYLYESGSTRRISGLPTYPFSKDRHWVETVGGTGRHFANRDAKVDLQPLHPLLHKNTSNFSEQRYSACFTGNEWFLRDHQIKPQVHPRQIVLPSVAYLEMAQEAVKQAVGGLAPHQSLQFQEVEWHDSVAVDESEPIHVGLYPEMEGAIAYEIYSSNPYSAGMTRTHHQGVIRLSTVDQIASDQPSSIPLADLKKKLVHSQSEKHLSAQDCYAVYQAMGIHYGLTYQGVEAVYGGDNEVLAQLNIPPSVKGTSNAFTLHPSLLDSALQASIGLDYRGETLPFYQPSFPATLENLEIREPAFADNAPDTLWAWIRLAPPQPKASARVLDVDLCDEDGTVYLSMRGVTLKNEKSETEYLYQKTGKRWISITEAWVNAPLDTDAERWTERIEAKKGHEILIISEEARDYEEMKQISQRIAQLAQNGEIAWEISYLPIAVAKDGGSRKIEATTLQTLVADSSPQAVFCFLGKGSEAEQGELEFLYTTIQTLMQAAPTKSIQFYGCFQEEGTTSQQWLYREGSVGFLKSAILETMDHRYRSITYDAKTFPEGGPPAALQLLQEWLCDETTTMDATRVPMIRYEQGNRLELQINETASQAMPQQHTVFREGGTYLMVGALGAVGEPICQELGRRFHAQLVILSRRPESEVKAALVRIEASGASVIYRSVDILDASALEATMASLKEDGIAIHGVIHMARQISDAPIVKKEFQEFSQVMSAKALGTLNIDTVTAQEPLDFFLVYSSTAAFGIKGSPDYAYSTAFQNALVRNRNRLIAQGQRSGQSLAICWGQWEMDGGVDPEQLPARLEQMRQMGVDFIDIPSAITVMDVGLNNQSEVVGFIPVNDKAKVLQLMGLEQAALPASVSPQHEAIYSKIEAFEQGTLLRQPFVDFLETLTDQDYTEGIQQKILRAIKRADRQQTGRFEWQPPRLSDTPSRETETVVVEPAVSVPNEPDVVDATDASITELIKDSLERVLKIKKETFDPDRALQDYGLDSISAMQLSSTLEQELDFEVLPNWFIEHPTINVLSDKLSQESASQ